MTVACGTEAERLSVFHPRRHLKLLFSLGVFQILNIETLNSGAAVAQLVKGAAVINQRVGGSNPGFNSPCVVVPFGKTLNPNRTPMKLLPMEMDSAVKALHTCSQFPANRLFVA